MLGIGFLHLSSITSSNLSRAIFISDTITKSIPCPCDIISEKDAKILMKCIASNEKPLVQKGQNGNLNSDYWLEFGTSLASPHVAGLIALLKVSHPEWSHAAIRFAIITTAKPFDKFRYPILD